MALTLTEAIEHAREVASSRTDLCPECRAEHEQLATWLADYQRMLKEIGPKVEPLPFQQYQLDILFPHQEQRPDPCANCSNNPANGGTGICLCTLGLPQIYC